MRAELKAQLAGKDGQVNGLVQELAATQQQLSDSQSRLDQVAPARTPAALGSTWGHAGGPPTTSSVHGKFSSTRVG